MSAKMMSEFEDVRPKSKKSIVTWKNQPIKTYHDGANEERSCILAKVRREMKTTNNGKDPSDGVLRFLKYLETWLLDRDKRYKKKAGGL